MKLHSLILLFTCLVTGIEAGAQSAMPAERLYKEIKTQDSLLFNAFNSRDTGLFKSMFTEDLEFFHDQGGLTGYKHTVDFMRSVAQPGNDLKRELVSGSLEVYPVPGYGAIQKGEHLFCHTENGKMICGTFQFIHIWQQKEGVWKIARVVSFGH